MVFVNSSRFGKSVEKNPSCGAPFGRLSAPGGRDGQEFQRDVGTDSGISDSIPQKQVCDVWENVM